MLIHYGAEFPDFVAAFEPAREIAYLADVARLENAWVEAYHAAEAEPLALATLAAIAPERLGRAALRLSSRGAAAAASPTPPPRSGPAHQGEGEPRAPEHWRPEDALIARPDADVVVRILPPGGYEFAAALLRGAALGEAAAPLVGDGVDPGAASRRPDRGRRVPIR